MAEETIHQLRKLLGYDNVTNDDSKLVSCPVCKGEYNHIRGTQLIEGHDKRMAGWWGRGDLVVIKLWCENYHDWEICLGFHKGQVFAFARTKEEIKIKYYEYIQSLAWKLKAEEAKFRAGYRCQVCNRSRDEVTLDAHHRTYQRLGKENPEDITVLCRDCHKLFETNKKAVTA